MTNLNNIQDLKKLDSANMLDSIGNIFMQCEHAWNDVKKIKFDPHLKNASNIIIAGMGGSALNAHVVQSIFKDRLLAPIDIVRDYTFPKYADKNTLLILSSYSGTTEEVVAISKTAQEVTDKITYMSSGGEILAFANSQNIKGYHIDPKYNECGQPRIALGYSIMGALGILNALNYISIDDSEITELIAFMKKIKEKFSPKNSKDNPAKEIAKNLMNSQPIIVTSDFLSGNAHVFANQINENAKTFSSYFINPELCHHLLEGLSFPENIVKNTHFIFVESDMFHAQNIKRYEVIKKLFANKKINFSSYKGCGKTYLQQSFEMIYLGSYISYYLAILNNTDPSPIPNVNFIKDELKKL